MANDKRVILIHGFNVWDGGKNTVDKLIPYLENDGYKVVEFDYGWTFLLGAYLGNVPRAKRLAKLLRDGDTIISHSNGSAISHRATQLTNAIRITEIFIHPALDRNAPRNMGTVCQRVVLHSKRDLPTRLASWIPGVIWGDMGHWGSDLGYDKSIVDRFDSGVLPAVININDGCTHSETFKYLDKYYPILRKFLP